ncbi:MAG: hypothetical protein ACJAXH_001241 [Colwellia sp.]|jgi:hypothetical protein
MQARYYDPVIGRFYSNDPVGYTAKNPVMSFNRYMYANNNPYKFTDPDGKFADCFLCKNPQYPTNGKPIRRSVGGVMAEQAGDTSTSSYETTTASEVSTAAGFIPTGLGQVVSITAAVIDAAQTESGTSLTSSVVANGTDAALTDTLTDSGKKSANIKVKAISYAASQVAGIVAGDANEKNETANKEIIEKRQNEDQ